MNLGLRIANLITNYAHAMLVGAVLFLLLRSAVRGDWLSVLALVVGGLAILVMLLVRLQLPFRQSARI